MKLLVVVTILCAAVIAPAFAQEEGSFGSLSWGPTGVPGLQYRVACNAFAGPAWSYSFENQTAKPIRFSYSFVDERADYAHVVPPHGRWALRRVDSRFACSSNGPLRVAPKLNP